MNFFYISLFSIKIITQGIVNDKWHSYIPWGEQTCFDGFISHFFATAPFYGFGQLTVLYGLHSASSMTKPNTVAPYYIKWHCYVTLHWHKMLNT